MRPTNTPSPRKDHYSYPSRQGLKTWSSPGDSERFQPRARRILEEAVGFKETLLVATPPIFPFYLRSPNTFASRENFPGPSTIMRMAIPQ